MVKCIWLNTEPLSDHKRKSRFSSDECSRYVQHLLNEERNIQFPEALAYKVYSEGTIDAFIESWIAKKHQAEEQERVAAIIPKRQFSEDPCKECFGIKRQ